MEQLRRIAAAAMVGVTLAEAAAAAPDFMTFRPVSIPDFAGIGVGAVPDYIGSDDYFIGAGPAAQLTFGRRYVSLQVNYATANLLDHPNWRAGPAAMWRFGRRDVKDDVVARLPEIDGTPELGAFAAYEIQVSPDPRDRWRFGGDLTHSLGGGHDGWTASASVRRWLPAGRFGALALSAAASWGSQDYTETFFSISPEDAARSGLPEFDADAGFRDVRTMAVFIQPLSERLFVGAGALYSRLVGDAADSPIVADRGSRDQWIVGVGAGVAF